MIAGDVAAWLTKPPLPLGRGWWTGVVGGCRRAPRGAGIVGCPGKAESGGIRGDWESAELFFWSLLVFTLNPSDREVLPADVVHRVHSSVRRTAQRLVRPAAQSGSADLHRP